MPEFGSDSKARLATCDPQLRDVAERAIKVVDFSVICGHRDKYNQDMAYETGHSTVNWPNSRHNSQPSQAFDFAPYPIEWPNLDKDSKFEYARKLARFYFVAGVILSCAADIGILIEWGGFWTKPADYGHVELVR